MRTFALASALSSLVVLLAACADDPAGPAAVDAGGGASIDAPGGLSDQARLDLLFTREEEKLARDVYDALDGNGQPFINIQASEQRHFDAIGALLTQYGLPDPAAGMGPGQFTDPVLQGLYTELVARGAPARVDALAVGCAIEELDLRDLALASEVTDAADIDATYASLMLGSRNHLRSFYGQLTAAGGTYTPVYLDQAGFDAVVNSPREQGGD